MDISACYGWLRGHAQYPQDISILPIIGYPHAMHGMLKSENCGLTDYLTKPLDEDLLLKKLNEYLE
jgi:hypothetical protein